MINNNCNLSHGIHFRRDGEDEVDKISQSCDLPKTNFDIGDGRNNRNDLNRLDSQEVRNGGVVSGDKVNEIVLEIVKSTPLNWSKTAKVALAQGIKDAVATFGSACVGFGVQTMLRSLLASAGSGALPVAIGVTLLNVACAVYQGQRLGKVGGVKCQVMGGFIGGIVGGAPGLTSILTSHMNEKQMTKEAIALVTSMVYSGSRDALNAWGKSLVPQLQGAPGVVNCTKDGDLEFNGKAVGRLATNTGIYGVLSMSGGAFGYNAVPILSKPDASWAEFFVELLKVGGMRAGIEGLDAFSGTLTQRMFFPDEVKIVDGKKDSCKEFINHSTARIVLNQNTAIIGAKGDGYWSGFFNTFTEWRGAVVALGDKFEMKYELKQDDVRNKV